MSKIFLDIGSTYIKVVDKEKNINNQIFRDFDKPIYEDVKDKCFEFLKGFDKKDINICSSANGGLTVFVVGLTKRFSLSYLHQTA